MADERKASNLDTSVGDIPLYGNPSSNLYQNNQYVYGNNQYPSTNPYPNVQPPNAQNQRPMNSPYGASPYNNQPNQGYVPPMGYGQPREVLVVGYENQAGLDPNSNEFKAEILAEKIRYGFPCFIWGNYCWMFFSIFFFFFEDVHFILSLIFAIVCNMIGMVAASVGNDAIRKCSQKRLSIYFNLIAIYFLSLIGRSVFLIIETGISGVFVFTYNAILPLVLWSVGLEIKKVIEERDIVLAATST